MRNWVVCIIILATSSTLTAGCAEETDRLRVYSVTGKVLVDGKEAEGVSIMFFPQMQAPEGKKMPVPAGVTGANGEFQLTSYDRADGAPAGEYKVAVVWNEPIPKNFTGVFEPKDRLRGRYASPDTSNLTATVEEGSTQLPPFELK